MEIISKTVVLSTVVFLTYFYYFRDTSHAVFNRFARTA